MRIPAVPEQVCNSHATEFWIGLLAFARNRPDEDEQDETPRRSGNVTMMTPTATLRPAA